VDIFTSIGDRLLVFAVRHGFDVAASDDTGSTLQHVVVDLGSDGRRPAPVDLGFAFDHAESRHSSCRGPAGSCGVRRVGGGAGKVGGPGDAPSQAATGSATAASKPHIVTSSAGAASGAGSSAAVGSQAAAGSGAATAAGPIGIGLAAAQEVGETGKTAGSAVKGAAEDALGSAPTAE
jgi:hypothetical protein